MAVTSSTSHALEHSSHTRLQRRPRRQSGVMCTGPQTPSLRRGCPRPRKGVACVYVHAWNPLTNCAPGSRVLSDDIDSKYFGQMAQK